MQFWEIQQKLGRQQQGEELAGLLSDEELAENLTDEELAGLITGEELAENLTDEELTDNITTDEAQAAIRDTHGRGASKWLAENAGIRPRTARTWLGSNPPVSRRGMITALGARNATAATRGAAAARATPATRGAAAARATPATRGAAAARADTSTRTVVADRTLPNSRRAAATLRGRDGRISAGKHELRYEERPEGSRNIWQVDIDLQPVIDNLEAGKTEAASDAFQKEILEEYGPDLSENLEIADFDPSLEIY